MTKRVKIKESQFPIISREIIAESGIRNIKELSNRYKEAIIYYHQDLDGVTSAIAMKNYLENNGIKVISVEWIQYGSREFSVKRVDANSNVMPVLVDFAHGKPEFKIHTDHHISQSGVEKGTSTSFKAAPSNTETLSGIVQPGIFPPDDLKIIQTVDSANFKAMGISPEDVSNFIFKNDVEKTTEQNKWIMGLATNKLILAYKGKEGFLNELVMNSTPSLTSMYLNAVKMAKERGLVSPEQMQLHNKEYSEKMKKHKDTTVSKDGKVVNQYGGGMMMKPGSYDRYTTFKNYPDSYFKVQGWPVGLVQIGCNPFKEKLTENVDLSVVGMIVLKKHEQYLKERLVTLDYIKWVNEKSTDEKSVGFKYNDLIALYGGDKIKGVNFSTMNKTGWAKFIEGLINKPYANLDMKQKTLLRRIKISAWDIINASSGGHKCIYNISGINYLGKGYTSFLRELMGDISIELENMIAINAPEKPKSWWDKFKDKLTGVISEEHMKEFGLDNVD